MALLGTIFFLILSLPLCIFSHANPSNSPSSSKFRPASPSSPLFRDRIFFFSDTHLASPWANASASVLLPQLLKTLTLATTRYHTLIIGGDLFDTWLYSFDQVVPTMDEYIASDPIQVYVDLFRRVYENGVDILMLTGNHDIELTQVELDRAGLFFIRLVPDFIELHNMRFEHGHRYDLFNAPDPSGTILPFGAIITRAYMEYGDLSGESESELLNWMCAHLLPYLVPFLKDEIRNSSFVVQRVIGGALGERIWEEAFNTKYEEYRDKTVRSGCDFLGSREDVILDKAVQKYRTLFQRWLTGRSVDVVVNLLRGMCYDYEPVIEAFEKAELYVQGHTHIPGLSVLQKTSYEGGKIVYVNSGAWTIYNDWFPFVRVTTNPLTGYAIHAELIEWTKEFTEVVRASSPIPATKTFSKTFESRLTPPKLSLKVGDCGSIQCGRKNSAEGIIVKRDVPPGWLCDPDFYGSNDGCDCHCGVWDIDCACEKEEEFCYPSCCLN